MKENKTFQNIKLIKNLIDLYVNGEADIDVRVLVNPDFVFLNRHKLLPVWFHCICELGLEREIGKHTYQMVDLFLSKQTSDLKVKESALEILVSKFLDNDLEFAIRKGISVSHLYKSKYHRAYNDIDIMIKPEDGEMFNDLLEQSGFEIGLYDTYKQSKANHLRKDIINYKLNPDHCPHRVKIVNSVPVIVDLAFSSSWYGHADYRKFTLENIQCSDRDGLIVLAEEHQLTDLLLHLYRESRMLNSLMKRPPYFLSYFDILLLIKDPNQPLGELDENSRSVYNDAVCLLELSAEELYKYTTNMYLSNNEVHQPFELFRFMSVPYRSEEKDMINIFKKSALQS